MLHSRCYKITGAGVCALCVSVWCVCVCFSLFSLQHLGCPCIYAPSSNGNYVNELVAMEEQGEGDKNVQETEDERKREKGERRGRGTQERW